MTEHIFPNISVFSKYSPLSKIIALFSFYYGRWIERSQETHREALLYALVLS